MRCTTCGEQYSDDLVRCPACGTARSGSLVHADPVRRCPRCGHRGDGIAYFRRPGHIALLVLFTVFTYGVGGLIYWLVKRQHPICPNCGLDWEPGTLKVGPNDPALAAGPSPGSSPRETERTLPPSGIFRRVLGVGAILLALVLVMVGVFELAPGLIIGGTATAATGALSYWWGWNALQRRRQSILGNLQRKVLLLASRKGGTLTVTEVAADLDLSMPVAEKVMMSMDDGFRIRSEVTNEGLLLYEFPELQPRTGPGNGADASHRIAPERGSPG